MLTKLESLNAFESESINKVELSKVLGGYAAPGGSTPTGAGSKNHYNECGDFLFTSSWTGDCNNGPGANGVDLIDYYGISASY